MSSRRREHTTSTTAETASTARVRLNVGGQRFEVSRELLMRDDTMLSRLVSDIWLRDPDEEIFIDRDGVHFRYVLDYLTYGEVTLPLDVSMDSFFMDLDFYCIHIRTESIRMEDSRRYETF